MQITPSGDVWWLPYNPDDVGANYGANWSKIALSATLPTNSPGSSGNGNGTGNTNGTSGSNPPTTRTGTGNSVSTNAPSNTGFNAQNSENSADGRYSFNGLLVGATVALLGLAGLFSSF